MNKKLYQFDQTLRKFLTAFLLALTFGVSLGLVFVYNTTNFKAEGAVERIKGSEISEEDLIEIPEEYPKSVFELLMTTHNHVIGFAFIFLFAGGIFYFNSIVEGFWKKFLLIEPFISTIVSFSSLWGIRFIDGGFVYLTIVSSSLIYISFYVLVGVSLYDLTLGTRKSLKE